MAEYIDRDTAIMTAMNYDGDGNAQDASMDISSALGDIPAADVKPVVHGRWVGELKKITVNCAVCSNCGALAPTARYCARCGATMDGES